MIAAHPDVPDAQVGETVRREWGLEVDTVAHVPVSAHVWHWQLGAEGGPQWFATLDPISTSVERRRRLASFDAAAQLGQRLSFVVAPIHTRDGGVGVDLAPGLLLTLTPLLEGSAIGSGVFADDDQRCLVASMAGDLHRHRRPRHLPVWRPRIGLHAHDQSADLEDCLGRDEARWTGGPWSGPAGRLVTEARSAIRQSLRRFALLAAAVSGNLDRWVVSHGEAHTANLVRTLDGHRLVDWGRAALAPRERDLRLVLGDAETDEPWYAYLESGGRPDPLSPDAVELFALERHLGHITEHAVLLSRPHGDGPDERRVFDALESEIGALVKRWA